MLFSKTVKSLFIFLFISILHLNLNAQLGLTGAHATMNAPNWQESMINSNQFNFPNDFRWNSSYKIGLDYQLKILPEKRVYIQAGVFYSDFREAIEYNGVNPFSNIYNFKSSLLEFNLNTNIYPFDFEGDCNCPTFSKDGSILKKGFFIQLSPGLSYANQHTRFTSNVGIRPGVVIPGPYTIISASFHPNLGIGIGLDIGITDFLTITPFARVKRHFNIFWDSLNNVLENGDLVSPSTMEPIPNDTSNIDQFEAGIRIEYRWKD